ncbi:hypothetical protein [Bradyrhizobium cenepequi]|uniref:hypothetical protein n=1 Tax=Bradyrhizobium cenepequi TaxID=2821403 RepID=UPI001CE2B3CF|nr:hypothetical protein [Bradyrhizobium cenepequi]MCA6108144.1 hypothetical protein [Bradyrhizobium cenepequi]
MSKPEYFRLGPVGRARLEAIKDGAELRLPSEELILEILSRLSCGITMQNLLAMAISMVDDCGTIADAIEEIRSGEIQFETEALQ